MIGWSGWTHWWHDDVSRHENRCRNARLRVAPAMFVVQCCSFKPFFLQKPLSVMWYHLSNLIRKKISKRRGSSKLAPCVALGVQWMVCSCPLHWLPSALTNYACDETKPLYSPSSCLWQDKLMCALCFLSQVSSKTIHGFGSDLLFKAQAFTLRQMWINCPRL